MQKNWVLKYLKKKILYLNLNKYKIYTNNFK